MRLRARHLVSRSVREVEVPVALRWPAEGCGRVDA